MSQRSSHGVYCLSPWAGQMNGDIMTKFSCYSGQLSHIHFWNHLEVVMTSNFMRVVSLISLRLGCYCVNENLCHMTHVLVLEGRN